MVHCRKAVCVVTNSVIMMPLAGRSLREASLKEQSLGGCAKIWTVVVWNRLRTQAAREAEAKPGSDSDTPAR